MITRHENMNIIRKIIEYERDENIDLFAILIYRNLSSKQETNKEEFIQQYQFLFRDYELYTNIEEKIKKDEISYVSDMTSAITALRNSKNTNIKNIFNNFKLETIKTQTLRELIIIISSLNLEDKQLYDLYKRYDNIRTENLKNNQLANITNTFIDSLARNDFTLYNPNTNENLLINAIEKTQKDKIGKVYISSTTTRKYSQIIYQALLNDINLDKIHFIERNDNRIFNDMKADIIVTNNQENRKTLIDKLNPLVTDYNIKTKQTTSIYMMDMIEHLSEDGIILSYQHKRTCFSNDEKDLRRYIINHNLLDAIIELPEKILKTTNISLIMFILRKNRSENDPILFIDATSFHKKKRIQNIITEEYLEKLIDIYNKKWEVKKVSKNITKDEIIENNYILNVNDYIYTFERNIRTIDYILNEISDNNKKLSQLEEEINNRIKNL